MGASQGPGGGGGPDGGGPDGGGRAGGGRATIGDVARQAGTSIATVSHVLHGTKYVRPQLAERVRAAAAALDYRPDHLARALRTARTGTLGVVLPDLREPRYAMLLKGCAAAAQAAGCGLMLEDAEGSWAREAQGTARLLEKRVDGLAVAPVGTTNDALARAVRRGMPVVLMDGLLDGLEVPAVLPDAASGVRAAVAHLWAGGHRRIGFVAGTLDTTLRRACFAGYEGGLAGYGRAVDPALVVSAPPDAVGGYKSAAALLGLRRPPTALFVAGSSMALGALQAIHERGLRCPEDVALVGLGDTEWAAAVTPSLSVVDVPDAEVGRRAVALLAGLRERPAPAERGARSGGDAPGGGGAVLRLATRLIVRRSSDGRVPLGAAGTGPATPPPTDAPGDADRPAV